MIQHRSWEDPTQRRIQAKASKKLWGYVLWVLFVSAVLCSLNTALVYALVRGLEPVLTEYMWGQPVMKYSLAIVPVLLVFAQWHAWDLLTSRRRGA